jgi:hypothetical protein
MVSNKTVNEMQEDVCCKYGVNHYPSPPYLKIGIDVNVRKKIFPINGLRHMPESDTTGWYIWAGEELSNDPDFFKPLHVEHLSEWCPQIQKYLGLPPGWRFLIEEDYEDVWYDESLLNI